MNSGLFFHVTRSRERLPSVGLRFACPTQPRMSRCMCMLSRARRLITRVPRHCFAAGCCSRMCVYKEVYYIETSLSLSGACQKCRHASSCAFAGWPLLASSILFRTFGDPPHATGVTLFGVLAASARASPVGEESRRHARLHSAVLWLPENRHGSSVTGAREREFSKTIAFV